MVQSSLKNYIKASPKTGTYSFRRRIPQKIKGHFVKEDGSLRGNEWNESLKTKSKSLALQNAVNVNERFERTKRMAKELLGVVKADSDRTQKERFADVANHYRRQGIHPDQAPTILASADKANAYAKKSVEAQWQLQDYQETVGIEIHGDPLDPANETYSTNEKYDEVQAEIDFLRGDQTKIKNRLKVTWEIALEEYINSKARLAGFPKDFNNTKPMKRCVRVANSFAKYLGNGSAIRGSDRFLTDISRQDARSWMDKEMMVRSGSTVGREISTLAAIFNRAITEYKGTDPALLSLGNPFSRLRTDAEKIDELAVLKGERVQFSSRAWTPRELASLKARLPLMNEEASLCAKLAMYTGARLHDVSGIMIDDLVLRGEENSQILFQHNSFRKISKDSIERKFPLYGEMLQDLKDYVTNRDFSVELKLTPRYAKNENSSSGLSDLLNQKHIDAFSKDRSLKMHGMRNTLQAKFDAASFANKISGYLIGWRSQETVGMQKSYTKQGYPQSQMLEVVQAAHAIEEWATEVQDT